MDKTKQQGFNLTSGNLSFGSKSDDVKNLQTYLSGMGYLGADGKPLKPDSIYGANTKAAVIQFQKANGLTPDGIVGPKTTAALNTHQTTPTQPNSGVPSWTTPEVWNALTPLQKATMQGQEAFINSNKQNGFKINPNTTIDEATAKKFMEQAKNKMHPVYAEQIDNELSQAQRDAEQLSNDYQNTLATQNDQFGTNLENNRNALAESGAGLSSHRIKVEQDMANLENRNRSVQDQSYQNKMGNIGRTLESQVGQANLGGFQLPGVASSRVGLQGVGGNRYNQGTIKGNWNPGAYKYGAIPREQQKATQNLSDYLIGQANEQAGQGRNYQNLMTNFY